MRRVLGRMNPDELDLKALAEELRVSLGDAHPVGYLRGKALMRDALVSDRGFSELEAEELIDTLEMQGYLHFLGDPAERSHADTPWDIEPSRPR
jgi:hypothetical protein